MPRQRLLKDTTLHLLAPKWRHLSPCFGALLAQSSPLKNNLWRIGGHLLSQQKDKGGNAAEATTTVHLANAAHLTRALYFQPHAGAPIRPTRSKSMAAAYLTPPIWGTLLGLALRCRDDNDFDFAQQVLRDRHGIRSNHVRHDTWTGVSMARWKDLIRYLAIKSAPEGRSYQSEFALSHAVWSMYLYETCISEQCALDALRHVQDTAEIEILSSDAQLPGVLIDSPDLSSTEELSLHWKRILSLHEQENTDRVSSMQLTQRLQNICASFATASSASRYTKPVCPNGYYGWDGGDKKPDCVEVAVRELMDLLLWDDETGNFDLSRLPLTASPILHELYRPIDQHTTKESIGNNDDFFSVQGGGKEWFDALSELPGCDYLSVSPDGKHYELTPTLRNMAKVFRRLLLDREAPPNEEDEWSSLHDLQSFWKAHNLQLSLGTLAHKAGMSDDTIVYEVATVALHEGAKNAIEMRLRCDWSRNTGFATVTHFQNQRKLLDESSLDQLLFCLSKNRDAQPWLKILALASLGDYGLLQRPSSLNTAELPNSSDEMLLLRILASRYGEDRRVLMHLASTTDLEREERALKKAQDEGATVLKSAIERIIYNLASRDTSADRQDSNFATNVQLLAWILSESPNLSNEDESLSIQTKQQMRFDYNLEQLLLSLPIGILKRRSVRQSLLENPFVRGKLLNAVVDWKTGNASLLQALSNVGLRQCAPFLWLSRKALSESI